MDVLKRSLLILFYVLVVLVGIGGFMLLRSLRGEERPFLLDQVKQEPTEVNR